MHQLIPPCTKWHYVLEGGALLHRVTWSTGSTYYAICEEYASYVTNHYGHNVSIVFDGYDPSTKDATHKRRSAHANPSPSINFKADMICKEKREDFLAYTCNKINMAMHFNTYGWKVTICNADADVPLVQEALEYARDQVTILVGDDTDLLILLCVYPNPDCDVFLKSEPKTTQKKQKQATCNCGKLWNIRNTKEALGETVCSHISFVHAILGCDTTSSLFGIGTSKALHNCPDQTFVDKAAKFYQVHSS